ncbi:MAG: hypothetical protein AB1324_03325 [Candidatus Micrarchaeota archaeon]
MLHSVKGQISGFLQDGFNRFLAAALLLLGAILLLVPSAPAQAPDNATLIIHFFYSPSCPHCAAQEPINSQLEEEFPEIAIARHNVDIPDEYRLLLIMAQEFGIGPESLGTPTTIIGDRIFVGYRDEGTTGSELRAAIERCLEEGCGGEKVTAENSPLGSVDLPLFGPADLSSLSLPLLAAVLGLLDGFNPCAMWVLVYLIGLLMNLNDKRRLALITGTFVLASGILYFLFMTAWLNAFLFLGYVRIVTIAVGLVALGGGVLSLREYLETRGQMVCKITGLEERRRMSAEIKSLISAPLTWATFLGIVAVAFTVNSIEFVCSSAIPAVFTQVLALKGLSFLEYYGYITLYDLFFMLDDILIFGSALLVVNSAGEKYAKYCRIVGGAIMLFLGIMLLFAPQYLS